jgi:hypothetical protein
MKVAEHNVKKARTDATTKAAGLKTGATKSRTKAD